MTFSTVTAAVSLRAPLAAQRVRASSSPRGTMTMIPAVASQRASVSETRLTQRGASCVAGDATLALKMPALRNKAVRNTAVTRAMAKDEESTAGISKKVARTSQACKTLGRWGFWGQLVLSTVSAVILVFSFLFKGITKVRHAASSIPSSSNRIPRVILLTIPISIQRKPLTGHRRGTLLHPLRHRHRLLHHLLVPGHRQARR